MSKSALSRLLISIALWGAATTTLYSTGVFADEITSTVLEEAEKVIEIVPERSKKIAQQFLTARTLADKKQGQSQNHTSRDEAENTVRTPSTSIKALQIIAKAKYILGDSRGSLISVEQAENLARTYNLPHQIVKVQILKATLLWRLTKDEDKTRTLITSIEQGIENKEQTFLDIELNYQLLMLKAEIATSQEDNSLAKNYFDQANNFLVKLNNEELLIKHQVTLGEYYLTNTNYNQALYQLLSAYWSAIENDKPILLAEINRVISDLFIKKSVLDKALEHLSQAADFYDNYENSRNLATILKKMADIYYSQGQYNLALVHYFNVLDSEEVNRDIEDIIQVRLDLAKTYLQLYNYPLAEQYLQRANALLAYAKIDNLIATYYLLNSELEFLKTNINKSLGFAEKALEIGEKTNNEDIQLHAYLLLTKAYEHMSNYSDAFISGKKYDQLITNKQQQLLTISENDFREQKLFIEQSLHFKDQSKLLSQSNEEQIRFRYASAILFVLSLLILVLFVRRGIVNKKMRHQLSNLYNDHYTHPRSGLRNFRLLNVKLPFSLEQSSANFEQWKTGDLINEPLHDKLRFIMIELPSLRTAYLQQGYNAGLQLEAEFGAFIKTKLKSPARLYHFADGMFLYVEPNTTPIKTARELFEQVNNWVKDFKSDKLLDRTIRAGIADYPFLPRAYTAINDKELIDILLMASNLARLQNHQHGGNQWVSLTAIENAPAASFASGDIRSACLSAIENGLIKIDSSDKIEDNIIKLSIIE
ncbi:tetratricopeptide repeat protein [Vibrio algarum]|uniref:Tetratricopeptide repeat protein n=1 Tax=Vibrio algarum TaxID=3020714 RepID=A0ABT4YSU6_9VIBR|nr:tetratricopeptide repeat protein [Vibrio sp. KJ40-1]MDB1124628.1 tetratricopeptide repeat protein [Vibrio sp. KJ40-1]